MSESRLCHLPPNRTFAAMQVFIATYEKRTGTRLSMNMLAGDVHYLREVLEAAIGGSDTELYKAAETLVLVLRAAPLPAAA